MKSVSVGALSCREAKDASNKVSRSKLKPARSAPAVIGGVSGTKPTQAHVAPYVAKMALLYNASPANAKDHDEDETLAATQPLDDDCDEKLQPKMNHVEEEHICTGIASAVKRFVCFAPATIEKGGEWYCDACSKLA